MNLTNHKASDLTAGAVLEMSAGAKTKGDLRRANAAMAYVLRSKVKAYKLTRAKDRLAMAAALVKVLETIPGVEIEQENGRALNPRAIKVTATVNGVSMFTEISGTSNWGVLVGWCFTRLSGETRGFKPSFAHQIGGTVNNCHWGKATGPSWDEGRDWDQFCNIVFRALEDVAAGGCIREIER